MLQPPRYQEHTPHLWIILATILALAALFAIEPFTARQRPVDAASSLEPALSPPGGYYDKSVLLKIKAPHPNASVIFTTDGSVPTHATGSVYTQPIRMSATLPSVNIIRARVVLPDGELGPVVSASYFVGIQATLPMMSLIADPGDLWNPERGIFAHALERGSAWERPVDITYLDKDRRSGFHVAAGIRIHGQWSRLYEKRSLRLYFRREYGVGRLEYPLFPDSDVQSFDRLILHNGGQDWNVFEHLNWTLMRNQLMANLAFEVNGYATHSRPVLLFINGEPWGIYLIRERIDSAFLADHYGIEATDLLEAPESLGQQRVPMGDRENWDHLLQFIVDHDPADPVNHAYVQSQVDLENLIDYHILQIYAANVDWPHYNTYQLRPRVQGGRWRWMFWDSDLGFGMYPYSSANTDFIAWVMDLSHPQGNGREALLIRKLSQNPAFLNRFLSRTTDLLNTTLSPQSVTAHIDSLAAELGPDIAYETNRWSTTVPWDSSVQRLRDFARQRPEFIRRQIVKRFDLNGTAQLTFRPPANGFGTVAVNDILLQDLPWQGTYFQEIAIQIEAAPSPGYRFAGWDPRDLPQTPAITLTVSVPQTITPRFEAIGRNEPRPGDMVFVRHSMGEDSHVRGSWFELQVTRPGGVDLRGWRVTDNDAKNATDEGSLIFADHPAFAHVPRNTTILVNVTPAPVGVPEDDLDAWDRRMVLYTGNGNLDASTDPGFNLGPSDNLVLLAPGPGGAFGDDQGIAFVAQGAAVTPASFGVLTDGVLLPATADSLQPRQLWHAHLSSWLPVLAGLAVVCVGARLLARSRKQAYGS